MDFPSLRLTELLYWVSSVLGVSASQIFRYGSELEPTPAAFHIWPWTMTSLRPHLQTADRDF